MPLSRIQTEKYADVMLWGLETARSKAYKTYDPVLLRWDLAAQPLAEAIYRKLLQRQRNVTLQALPTPAMEEAFYNLTDSRQRAWVQAGTVPLYEHLTGNIFLHAPASLTHLKHTDPVRIAEAAKARKPLRDILDAREERGLLGWTLCTWPTPALAEQAGITLEAYTRQVVRACFLEEKDPVKKWQEIFDNTQAIKKWLNGLGMVRVRVESAHTDLEVTIGERRRFLGVSGHNIPSFEIFTSPDWRGARGRYHADQPSFRSGNVVAGIQLEFEKGKAVKADAARGGDYLRKMLAMDAGACRIGEFSLTDRRFSNIDTFMADTLYDENFGGKNGNCHIALGNSYSDTYAGNPATLDKERKKALGFNSSALHWDMVNTEPKTVTAVLKKGGTKVIYDQGQFQL